MSQETELRRAAMNVSDRRTLLDDGFWVSKKEMRSLDLALGHPYSTEGGANDGVSIGPIQHSNAQCQKTGCDCWCQACERHNWRHVNGTPRYLTTLTEGGNPR